MRQKKGGQAVELRNDTLDRQAARPRLFMLFLVLRLRRSLLLHHRLSYLLSLLLLLLCRRHWGAISDHCLLFRACTRASTLQSSEVDPGHSAVEGLALLGRELDLLCAGLARAIAASERACAPRRAAADLAQVGQDAEGGLVAQRDEDHAVVHEGRHGADDGGLLASARGGGADEHAGVLAPEGSGLPLAAGLVPEDLELGGEVSESANC